MSTTGRVTRIGRSFFAISIVAFGIQQFVYTGFLKGLALVPEWVPAHALFAYLAGTVLITAGVCVAIEVEARAAASLLGLLLLMCVLFLHGPRIGEVLRDIVERTRAFETLALCAAAFIIAGTLPRGQRLRALDGATNEAVEWAPFCLAVSLAIFGLDHLLAAKFVAGLVPTWIPWHLFWVYLTAFGFFAAAISIAARKLTTLVEGLLGLMFFLWVVVLHAPRVAANLHNGEEWNSAFVALAMCGGAIVAAAAL